MLKTFAKNSVTSAADLLKQSAAWGIELTSRYRTDIFLRANVHVIALQIVFGIAVIVVFWIALNNAQENIATAIASGIADIVNTSGTVSGDDVLARIQETRRFEFVKIFLVSVFIAIFFGYFVSRATLLPAKSALGAQKRFIGNIAHELRTPLSIIKTNIEVLLLDISLPQTTRKPLEQTVREVDRTSEIINNLLSLNTYLNPTTVTLKNVDLARVARRAVRKIAGLAENKRITLNAASNSTRCVVSGNETALEQVVLNLLRNAITHTPRGGNVSVLVEPDREGFVMLTIQDSGSGISRKDLLHIFEPYYRAEISRSREKGGSGLGLTIVNEIVRMHRGKIHVESTFGKGTTVIVCLPSIDSGDAGKESGEQSGLNQVAMDFSRRFFE